MLNFSFASCYFFVCTKFVLRLKKLVGAVSKFFSNVFVVTIKKTLVIKIPYMENV